MADNSTGLPVQTISGQFVSTKLVDSGGTNVAAVSAGGALSVSLVAASATVTVDTELTAVAALADATANPTITNIAALGLVFNGTTWDRARGAATLADALANPGVGLTQAQTFLMGYNGSTWDRVRTANTGRLQVDVITGGGAGTQYVGDAAATATPTGTMAMGLANAAAPADVSANNDAVAMWMLRNGSPVMNLASGGTLITVGQKAMASSIPVVLPSDGYGADATHVIHAILGTGAADYTLFGQTQAASPYMRISDGTTVPGVIVGTTALKTDMSSIVGAVPAATNPLPVRLTDGAAFYSAASQAPTSPKFSTKTSSALGAGASVDMTHYVTSGKTGQLAGIDVGSTVPLKVVINTELTAAKTSRVVLFTKAFDTYQWRSPYKTYITQASSDATSGFSVTVKNMDAAVAADVYSTGFWDEV